MRAAFAACLCVFATLSTAVAQTSPTPGFPDPVFDNPIQPPPKSYEPPVQPPAFVPPPPAPMYQPRFPGARPLAAPVGPARPVLGAVCVVPTAKRQPAIRCATERAPVGAACRCDDRAGRVRTR